MGDVDRTPAGLKTADQAHGFELKDLVGLYTQQVAAVNQLWAMFAATTFAAGVFALTVADSHPRWLLLAGGLGFLFFAIGHYFMVQTALLRQDKAREAIADALPDQPPAILTHYAEGKVPIESAGRVHIAIDACVLLAFVLAAVLERPGSG